MNEIDIFDKLNTLSLADSSSGPFNSDEVAKHKIWLNSIRRERPNTATPYRIGIYIRYFNQTKHENYLSLHKMQFIETIELCPQWTLVDFYVDEGSTAPNMESAKEWCRLLDDCLEGKIDLIITQKISNVSSKLRDLTFCIRLLANQPKPIGIYFISEDIYTLASYYLPDMKDESFLLLDNKSGGLPND